MKQCLQCKELKKPEEFYRDSKNHGRPRSRCKACCMAYGAGRTSVKQERDRERMYGLSKAQYDVMAKAQNNLCLVCEKPETAKRFGKVRQLSVDHDHGTGKVRGLLCAKHNLALGLLDDNFEHAYALAKYLHEHKGVI